MVTLDSSEPWVPPGPLWKYHRIRDAERHRYKAKFNSLDEIRDAIMYSRVSLHQACILFFNSLDEIRDAVVYSRVSLHQCILFFNEFCFLMNSVF